ncbi:response regulator [Sphingosinicella sp. BN140058]|uniref:response regulator n=1 Tax=Sphingosinicella sp. BN140058 TaxID=1892855 RepID=UPI0010103398|nr:response regulator [Sphingosinicella sp. BN140058]QAY76222.1 response regulator [Sphingosinicella sp. BN140058]
MSIAGTRILLVEDEAIIAMMAEDMLEELGCEIAAAATALPAALELAEQTAFDVALLDINLNGVDSAPLAEMLRARGTPFIFTTGYGSAGRPPAFTDVPLVSKPYRAEDLAEAIRTAISA